MFFLFDPALTRKSEGYRGVEKPGSDFEREVGTRLREVEKLFRNREEAAMAAGVAKSTFQRWVEGKADPSFHGLTRLAAKTGVSLDWLATGWEPDPKTGSTAPADSGAGRGDSVDEALLGNVVEGLERFLEDEDLRLRPDRRARLVVLLYRHMARARAEEAARGEARPELHEPGHPIDPRSIPLVAEILLTLR